VLLNQEKAKEIEAYYAKCADEGSTKEDIAKSKKAMSSLEMILGEPDRLEKLAVDIHDHYVSSVANDPDRVQKAMIVCSNRKIAYDLLLKFKAHYPEWFDERKTPEGVNVSPEELKELKEMPTIAMVASVGSNDAADMYNYLGGVKNDQRSEDLDAAFKQVHSNFRIVIVVDMWITGFDVECLTYMYNDKPLQKHSLIQTISRANRKYPGKEYGLIVDYIGIRDQMLEARKMYGGDNSVALTEDDIEQATLIFREYMEILKALFRNYDLTPFLNPETDPATRYTLLAKAAEFVFSSNENFNSVSKDGKKTKKVTFKTYFLQNVKRMRKAYDLCQPSGELSEEESALAQCFMAIAGMIYKMNGTDAPDTDTMNRRVAKMVEEALKYNNVESILEEGEEMDIFGPEFTERLEDIKMPASKLETLIKLLRKQISDYGKTNQVASKKFQEMLEATIQEYHDRRKFLSEQEAGATQEATAESIIKNATEQALNILKGMQADRESFRKLGLTFEEKAFYDILIHLRDKNNFEYGEDKEVDGIVINDKCKSLACKIRDIIDAKSSFADWLNNQRVRDQLKQDIKICLVKNGYPPQYTPEVFREVMEQVENFKENEQLLPSKLDSVEDDQDVRNLIYMRLQMDATTSDGELQREAIELYGERYPSMSINDWRHIIDAYTPMVRNNAQSNAKEVNMQYGMAAENLIRKIELSSDELDVLRHQLKGDMGFMGNEKARALLSSVIDKAEKLMKELDAYEESGNDLLYWFYEKYKAQNGIIEKDLRPKGKRRIIID